jgi:hypothetical protein
MRLLILACLLYVYVILIICNIFCRKQLLHIFKKLRLIYTIWRGVAGAGSKTWHEMQGTNIQMF